MSHFVRHMTASSESKIVVNWPVVVVNLQQTHLPDNQSSRYSITDTSLYCAGYDSGKAHGTFYCMRDNILKGYTASTACALFTGW